MNARSRFEDIIQPYLTAINNIPDESAAKDVLTVVSDQLHIDPATSGDVFYTLWGVIFDYAQSAPCADYTTGEPNDANLSYLGRLAALVNDVRAAVKSDADLRSKLADDWLAQFGWEARDRFNFSPCSDNQGLDESEQLLSTGMDLEA
ncbi:hypothetical protein LTR05_005538 [Lithohypha guttulata]|uniref:Uncharacterized protein n=1 Tax=Lithohypha guttulata TaxID=1690604 RepID=A0AAN7Y5J6_9EURO|nr:hypothetical protein LTR05_005538 [Lithohypha guttulata]